MINDRAYLFFFVDFFFLGYVYIFPITRTLYFRLYLVSVLWRSLSVEKSSLEGRLYLLTFLDFLMTQLSFINKMTHSYSYTLSGSHLEPRSSIQGRIEIMVMEIFAEKTNPDFRFMTRSAINEHIKEVLEHAHRRKISLPPGHRHGASKHSLPVLHARDLRKVWFSIFM